MPFTPNRRFKRDPRLIAGAEGMHYITTDGHRLLDGTAGLWCVNAGHAQPQIVAAIQDQAAALDYVPNFGLGHESAFTLARRLADLAPSPLDRVFFSNSGSEAVDTALKIALAYQRARGQGTRQRLIGRERSYHGVGFGGLSVAGLGYNRRQFGLLLPGVDHLPHPHDSIAEKFLRDEPEQGAEAAEALERRILLHDPSTIAAVIVEPVSGAPGVLAPPKGYLQRLRAICDRYDILLIFDEVICGFGRLGAAFAAERFGVVPDMMTMAKGLTNGVVPMGATVVRRDIYEAVVTGSSEHSSELAHGYTYSGHPLACAAALATMDVHAALDLAGRTRALSSQWANAAHALRELPYVNGIRTIGLLAAIDLDSDQSAPGRRAYDCFRHCFDRGVLIRTGGDMIVLSPPLIIGPEEIEQLFASIAAALRTIA